MGFFQSFVMPVALQGIFDNVECSIIVLDKDYKIVTCNMAFYKNFSVKADIIDSDIGDFIKNMNIQDAGNEYEVITERIYSKETLPVSIEICMGLSRKKYYHVKISPILSKRGSTLGKVLLFNDITGYKTLFRELDENNSRLDNINQELLYANKQLEDYASVLNDFAIIKERNRLAEEMHSTTGKQMLTLTAMLDDCNTLISSRDSRVERMLQKVLLAATNGLRELRRSVRGISSFGIELDSVSQSLKRMIADFGSIELQIELNIDGNDKEVDKKFKDAILLICKEAAENAICHSRAQCLNIILKFKDDRIKLYIMDDGIGCAAIVKGRGIRKIESAVEDLHGTITYGSSVDNGFNIHIEFALNS